jgi:hypothetical protein
MRAAMLVAGLVVAMGGVAVSQVKASSMEAAAPVRVSNRFEFMVEAPMERAAPLFGPEGERCWAGERWDPKFVYPQPAKDQQGAVFTVLHGGLKSVWVNTVFDLAGGRMQYVTMVPEAMVSTIDVRLRAAGTEATRVEVGYVRTALDAELNAHVTALGAQDRESGPEWEKAIAECLAKQGAGGS